MKSLMKVAIMHCSKCFISWISGSCKKEWKRRVDGGSGGPVIMEMNDCNKGAREDPSPVLMKVRAVIWAKHSFLRLHFHFISKMLEETAQVAVAPIGHKSGLPQPRIVEAANPSEALIFVSLINHSSKVNGAADQLHDQFQGKGLSCRLPS